MENHIQEVLFTKEAIANKVKELGVQISADYENTTELVVIGVLKGANIFLGDLIREIKIPLVIDFMAVSSYGMATESSGVVRILKDLDVDVSGKHVLLIEDIVDTGLTLQYLKENLERRNLLSLKICTLLDKPMRRKCDVRIDYKGFEIPDQFIVGYGIDYAEKYRNLPFIGVIKEELYKK